MSIRMLTLIKMFSVSITMANVGGNINVGPTLAAGLTVKRLRATIGDGAATGGGEEYGLVGEGEPEASPTTGSGTFDDPVLFNDPFLGQPPAVFTLGENQDPSYVGMPNLGQISGSEGDLDVTFHDGITHGGTNTNNGEEATGGMIWDDDDDMPPPPPPLSLVKAGPLIGWGNTLNAEVDDPDAGEGPDDDADGAEQLEVFEASEKLGEVPDVVAGSGLCSRPSAGNFTQVVRAESPDVLFRHACERDWTEEEQSAFDKAGE